jgi:hypothetical protein
MRIVAEMNKLNTKKKVWVKPTVHILDIKKDTFSGSGNGAEDPTRKIPNKW